MATAFSFNLASGTTVTWTSLNSLGNSATAGCQTAAISLVDANNNTPESVDFQFTVKLTNAGSPANDKCVYFWVARSIDGGTTYEQGPPALGSTDTTYTLSTAITTVAPPWIGTATPQFQANDTTQTAYLTLVRPPTHIILVALNYAGIALASSGNTVKYRTRFGDLR